MSSEESKEKAGAIDSLSPGGMFEDESEALTCRLPDH